MSGRKATREETGAARRVASAGARATYTVEQANRALPLVRRIVDDLVAAYRDWQRTVHAFEYAASASRAEAPDSEAERLQREAQQLAGDIDGFVRELADLGVECKGFDRGLVDFPSERDGRAVYLCWMRGEPAVAHWH